MSGLEMEKNRTKIIHQEEKKNHKNRKEMEREIEKLKIFAIFF